MEFKDKITQTMQILGITNSQLAERLDIDMSLVSRWRTGNRLPSNRGTHMEQIADYFLECAHDKDLMDEFIELLGLSADSHRKDSGYLMNYVITWLGDDTLEDNSPYIRDFINKVEFFIRGSRETFSGKKRLEIPEYLIKDTYIGVLGKRDAMIRLLHNISQSEPMDIYFYSDESLEWITDDIEFYFLFNELLTNALAAGHKLNIIQLHQREFKDIMESIERWLPIYLSGQIRTYYIPHEMAGAFANTVVVAGHVAAMKSSSLKNQPKDSINFYVTEDEVVETMLRNMENFASQCELMMNVFGYHDQKELGEYLLKQGDNPGDLIALHQTLSTMTIPIDQLGEFTESEFILKGHVKRTDLLKDNLANYKYIEILSLPTLEEIDGGKVQVELSSHISSKPVFYNREIFKTHLDNVITWLETYQNYSVIILDKLFLEDVRITVKKNTTAILYKISPYPIALAFNNKQIIEAFYSYIVSVIKESDQKTLDRDFALQRLKDFRNQL